MENHPYQKGGDGYIYCEYFCEKALTIVPRTFYGTVLIRHTVVIDSTDK